MTDQHEQQDGADQRWFWQELRYSRPQGGVIIERITHGDAPSDFARFVGVAPVSVQMPDGRTASREMQFDIEAESIEDAFARFDERYQAKAPKAAQKLQQDMLDQMKQHQRQQRRIKTPAELRQ